MSNIILRPENITELRVFAEAAARSNVVPPQYKGKPDDVMIAVQMGSEVGLAPMQSLQNIAVINSRPALFGDAMLALCKAHPAWDGIKESIGGEGDERTAICEVSRKGDNPVTARFSVADAKRANLWGKTGPWTQYPDRMLQMRARGFGLRDAFPDALKGLISGEEAQDIPTDTFKGTTIEAKPEPVPEPEKPTIHDRVQIGAANLLAAIKACKTEDDLHDLRGLEQTQTRIEYLRANFPDLHEQVDVAFREKFNDFLIPEDTR